MLTGVWRRVSPHSSIPGPHPLSSHFTLNNNEAGQQTILASLLYHVSKNWCIWWHNVTMLDELCSPDTLYVLRLSSPATNICHSLPLPVVFKSIFNVNLKILEILSEINYNLIIYLKLTFYNFNFYIIQLISFHCNKFKLTVDMMILKREDRVAVLIKWKNFRFFSINRPD